VDIFVESYLKTIGGHLKSMSGSQRKDILAILESRIKEICYFEHLSTYEAIKQIGDPLETARHHLRVAIGDTKGMSLRKLRMMFSLYRTSHSSYVVLPILSVLSLVLLVTGIVVIIVGLVKAGSLLLSQSTFEVLMPSSREGYLHDWVILPLVVGGILALIGLITWNLMTKYLKTVGVDNQKFD